MIEYGNGVGQVAGQAGGGGGGQAQNSVDFGATFVNFVSNSVHTISTLPPTTLIAIVVIILVGFVVLKRAF